MVVSAEQARQKAEARRQRILAKSAERLDMASNGMASKEVEHSVPLSPVRRRRNQNKKKKTVEKLRLTLHATKLKNVAGLGKGISDPFANVTLVTSGNSHHHGHHHHHQQQQQQQQHPHHHHMLGLFDLPSFAANFR